MTWFFTADCHFSHKLVARIRGFPNENDHDLHILEQWNNTVKGGDVVVVCGDFTLETHAIDWIDAMWKALNGNKILVTGNHDYWVKKLEVQNGVRKIYHKTIKQGVDRQFIVACHYPIQSWYLQGHGSIHVHGHSHGKVLPTPGRLDVGLDVAKIMLGEYRPFSYDEVLYLTKGLSYDGS